MRLLPEDAAAIVMKEGDVNDDLVLEADELIAVARSFRNLDLGTGARFFERS